MMVPTLLLLIVVPLSSMADELPSSSEDIFTNSLLMKKSSTRRISFDATEEEAGRKHGTSMAEMISFVEGLAGKVAGHNYTLTSTEQQALNAIKSFIEKMQSSFDKQHNEDQREVNRVKELIEACANQTKTSLETVKNLNISAKNKCAAHDNCRTDEGAKNTSQTVACNDYDTYRKTNSQAQAPDCLKTINQDIGTSDETARQNMESCLEAAKTWLDPLYEKYKNCKRKKAEHQNNTDQCNKGQDSFEKIFCSYKSKLEETCDLQVSCRNEKIEIQAETHADVKISEAARKADYISGQIIACFFKVFEAGNEEKTNILTDCQNKTIDASHYNIIYPNIPAAADCKKDSRQPCDEYVTKRWTKFASAAYCEQCATKQA